MHMYYLFKITKTNKTGDFYCIWQKDVANKLSSGFFRDMVGKGTILQ